MNDYICPECGHDVKSHGYNKIAKPTGCIRCDCTVPISVIYEKLLANRDQALAEAREAMQDFDAKGEWLKITNWLKKWSEK